MQARQIEIIGMGIISAIGYNVDETLLSFKQHKSGIKYSQYLNTKHKNNFPCGEVTLSNDILAAKCNLKPTLSRNILLSYYAAKQSIAHLDFNILKRAKIGFISASTVGGMDKTTKYFQDKWYKKGKENILDTRHHDCGKSTDYVFQQLGLKGLTATISTACSSSANAILFASRLIERGTIDIAIAGGVDALTNFTLNGFNSLLLVDKEQCRPLSEDRNGLNLGEGSAYLVLTNETWRKNLMSTSLGVLSGYANVNDSHHQTALSDDGKGPVNAMYKALNSANLKPDQIDYINVHGTGTQNNDQAEMTAIKTVFNNNIPFYSSTKSFTGHTLAACGAIESVISLICLKEGIIVPNYSCNNPMKLLNKPPVEKTMSCKNIQYILSNSFGFGGNCTSLIYSK